MPPAPMTITCVVAGSNVCACYSLRQRRPPLLHLCASLMTSAAAFVCTRWMLPLLTWLRNHNPWPAGTSSITPDVTALSAARLVRPLALHDAWLEQAAYLVSRAQHETAQQLLQLALQHARWAARGVINRPAGVGALPLPLHVHASQGAAGAACMTLLMAAPLLQVHG